MLLLLYALRIKESNAGVKNGICKYQMLGMLQHHYRKRLCDSKLGRRLFVQACVPAVADMQYNLKHVA